MPKLFSSPAGKPHVASPHSTCAQASVEYYTPFGTMSFRGRALMAALLQKSYSGFCILPGDHVELIYVADVRSSCFEKKSSPKHSFHLEDVSISSRVEMLVVASPGYSTEFPSVLRTKRPGDLFPLFLRVPSPIL